MGVVDYTKQGDINVALLPKRYDIEIYQGDTFKMNLNFKDSNNAAVDISGWTPLMEIKSTDNTTVVSTATFIINNPVGTLVVQVLDTGTIAVGSYIYDLELTDNLSNKRTFIGGIFKVTEDISE